MASETASAARHGTRGQGRSSSGSAGDGGVAASNFGMDGSGRQRQPDAGSLRSQSRVGGLSYVVPTLVLHAASHAVSDRLARGASWRGAQALQRQAPGPFRGRAGRGFARR
jgi:hypothetical protein